METITINGNIHKVLCGDEKSKVIEYFDGVNIVDEDGLVFPTPVTLQFNGRYAKSKDARYKKLNDVWLRMDINATMLNINDEYCITHDDRGLIISHIETDTLEISNDVFIGFIGELPLVEDESRNFYIYVYNIYEKKFLRVDVILHDIGRYMVFIDSDVVRVLNGRSIKVNRFSDVWVEGDMLVTRNNKYKIEDALKLDMIL